MGKDGGRGGSSGGAPSIVFMRRGTLHEQRLPPHFRSRPAYRRVIVFVNASHARRVREAYNGRAGRRAAARSSGAGGAGGAGRGRGRAGRSRAGGDSGGRGAQDTPDLAPQGNVGKPSGRLLGGTNKGPM